MSSPPIHFDYEFSPYGQKTKLLLQAAGIPFQRIDQPAVLPRPDLEKLGITYRRIPLLAVGKDVYADSALIIDVILNQLGASSKLKTTVADKAYSAWGDATFFAVLPLIPPQALSDAFVQDRKTVFPIVARKDFNTLSDSGAADLRSRIAWVENTLLKDSPYVGGDKLSLADIHIIWPIRWALFDLGAKQRPELGKEAFPKVWKLIESLPEAKGETIKSEEGIKSILGAQATTRDEGIEKSDPLGLKAGTEVSVESSDATPGAHTQTGKLIGSSVREIVLETDAGVRLHFPREGYVVREA